MKVYDKDSITIKKKSGYLFVKCAGPHLLSKSEFLKVVSFCKKHLNTKRNDLLMCLDDDWSFDIDVWVAVLKYNLKKPAFNKVAVLADALHHRLLLRSIKSRTVIKIFGWKEKEDAIKWINEK